MTDVNHRMLDGHEYLQSLGISLDSQEAGEIRVSLPFDSSLTNFESEVMHGGVVATLIDHAAGAAHRTVLEDPLETGQATTDLNVTYLEPATNDLTATATVIRDGRTMGVVSVEVTQETPAGEETVAVGRVTLFLDRN